MKRFFLLLLLWCVQPLWACTVTDDAGQRITLTQPAQRIISLAPDSTELLYAVNAGDRIVATVAFSDYPKAARSLLRIGNYHDMDREKLLTLQPDLIVASGYTFAKHFSWFKTFHIPVYLYEPHQLEDIPRTLLNLGCLTGQQDAGKKASARFMQSLEKLRQQYQQKPPVTVYFQLGSGPLMTINQHSWINEAIILCGGVNPFAHSPLPTPTLDTETLLSTNPQVIISAAEDTAWKQQFTKWPTLAAVRRQQLYTISSDLLERAGPRLIDGITLLCQDIQQVRAL